MDASIQLYFLVYRFKKNYRHRNNIRDTKLIMRNINMLLNQDSNIPECKNKYYWYRELKRKLESYGVL